MAKGYVITGQKLDKVINEAGDGFSQQWNVGYMVTEGPAEGTRGEVHIPPHQLTGPIVHAAISKLVDAHNEVAGY